MTSTDLKRAQRASTQENEYYHVDGNQNTTPDDFTPWFQASNRFSKSGLDEELMSSNALYRLDTDATSSDTPELAGGTKSVSEFDVKLDHLPPCTYFSFFAASRTLHISDV